LNPGSPPRPLSKGASGGELSRILLALKCALAQADPVPTQIFDEIDTGIGGATAETVGRKIRSLADDNQVICITHLPQIAVFADHHTVVSKAVIEGSSRTQLLALQGSQREEEIARMLGGAEITDTTRQHAREMIGFARDNT
ncbi:MAG: DNA repair protein RecN, partial [Myxococcales bacterium]|nr:DNA repair protein RecN [Myxococcales bacterium]